MPAHRTLHQAKLAINLLVVSLSVFFLAAMTAMVLASRPLPRPAPIPTALWLATGLALATSFFLRQSVRCVRREMQIPFRRWLGAALTSGLMFVLAQGVGLFKVFQLHQLADGRSQSWIFLFVLIGLHCLHVIVGLILLALGFVKARRGRFDHEYHLDVLLTSRYWHFLDVVWLAVLCVCAYLLR